MSAPEHVERADELRKLTRKFGFPLTPIEDAEFGTRTKNALHNRCIRYVEEVANYTADQLLCIPNFGRKSLHELVVRAEDLGVRLKGSEPGKRAGILAPAMSTESKSVNSGGNENMKSVEQNRFEAPRLDPGEFMGIKHCFDAPAAMGKDPSEFFQGMLAARRSYKLALDTIREMMFVSHGASYAKGWWHDKETGERLDQAYQVPIKLALIHSEISEALEADRKGLQDDKLPHRAGIEVELADALHRIFDLAGALNLDLGWAFVEKAIYNAKRPDHAVENRNAANGKAY
ncbi:HTH-domain containing protein [Ruegeria phage vB_RpoS-V16]|uniref:pyrophosphatase n=1 Tax=Ruegeria phage vB_RpoS-V16 TaxID=2218618 RepID=UPI000DCAC0A4|nr:pyrophosphatase [Ruegeria phage vB_RpoS-V16]AWY09459.1 HTH-domain containing protein [Ruegeria phage vB_RpoS-V16]